MKNTKQVMVRMPPFLYEQLKEAADMTMTTPSAMARILIKQQLGQWDLSDDQDELPLEETTLSSSPGQRSTNSRRRKKKKTRR